MICRFYYGDEQKADGTAKYRVDGEAHAKLYWGACGGKDAGPLASDICQGHRIQEL